MKQSDLKPCPFDGYFPSVILYADEGEVEFDKKYYVKCSYCGAEGPHCTNEDGACKSWNHRYKEQDARPVRKAKSPALDTKEICHTAPNTRSLQLAAQNLIEAATKDGWVQSTYLLVGKLRDALQQQASA